MKKSRMKLFLALALCMALVCMAATAMAVSPVPPVTDYGLWVGGVQVTSANMNDITAAIEAAIEANTTTGTVSGSASYDPDTNTLTLNNFNYTGSGHSWNENLYQFVAAICYKGNPSLNLVLEGTSSVTGSDVSGGYTETCGIFSAKDITVKGDGSLTATGGTATAWLAYSCGVRAQDSSITVESGSLMCKGGPATSNLGSSYGVRAGSDIEVTGSGSLTGKGGTTTGYNSISYGVFSFGGSIKVKGGSLTGEGGEGETSYGVSANNDITVNGGVVEAQGEDQAFNKAPSIDYSNTVAKVWAGSAKKNAAELGNPSDLAQKYTEKYVRIAPFSSVGVTIDGSGTVKADPESGEPGTKVTLTATPNAGYQFKEWQVVSGGVTIEDNAFTIGSQNVEIRAIFEPIPVLPGQIGQPGQTDLPKTGDSSSPMFWLATGILSVLGILLLRRKAYSR